MVGQRSVDVKIMIGKITEGEFELGEWSPVLIGACGYVVLRIENKLLPRADIVSVLNGKERLR